MFVHSADKVLLAAADEVLVGSPRLVARLASFGGQARHGIAVIGILIGDSLNHAAGSQMHQGAMRIDRARSPRDSDS